MFHRRHTIPASGTEALIRVLSTPTFELIPLKGSMEQAALLPPGARISVTASPSKSIEATLILCESLRAAGFDVVPHLSARMVRDGGHLAEIVARLTAARISSAFVVGGDAKASGEYPDGLSLLRAMSEIGHGFTDIGIPCYPQGHAFIADGPLLEALRAKAAFATYMTTQLCFDATAIASWLAARRAEGLTLPAHIGVPGVMEAHRLVTIGTRIGIADTQRFISRNVGVLARLVRSAGFYRPDALLEALAPHVGGELLGIVGLHVYTFNAVGATEGWRRAYLAALGRSGPSAVDAHSTAGGRPR